MVVFMTSSCHQRVLGIERQMVSGLSQPERRTLADLLERCAGALHAAVESGAD
jgi:hypothetical protein